ncbi:UNVERIFIED_CONTAM: protein SUPPRESSOR OF NPR1-1 CONSTITUTIVE 4 [Sesamum calycinum]|uniref:non-specific serine/threonine protein kinase n=1 Tax=Sesamum calycinum TaxID=2727403 RepID=A0AAW2SYY2_9LAMI
MMEADCGLLMVDKCESENPAIRLGPGGNWYDFLERISETTILIRDLILQDHLDSQPCFLPVGVGNLSLPKSPSISFTAAITKAVISSPCIIKKPGSGVPAIGESRIPQGCAFSQLPMPNNNSTELLDMLTAEFTVEWNLNETCYECHHGGGQCLSDIVNGFECRKPGNRKFKTILLVGGVTLSVTASIILLIFLGRKRKQRYKYSDLKKMTSSFSETLGRGGYGNVYKGKLPDGRPVAVKILNESKENGEDFMNEVASISRTSHVNIVSLLGFCFEGSKRALVYEFMPNGSLEKFIHNSSTSLAEYQLGWEKLFEIAVGIARGLDYLHQGCNTRILHFDIKPHNILLDKDFNPKISDFGLAKLCPNRSNVYSYGMMALEMAVGRQNLDHRADRSSEIYFPDWIYKHLEVNTKMDLHNIENEDESHFVRKMVIVGLWCIQTEPKNRPSISRVVEMLAGSMETLEIPPRPGQHSPPRPAVYSSSILSHQCSSCLRPPTIKEAVSLGV